jgi:UDP-glucose 4-epimerase
MGIFIGNALREEPIKIFGDGHQSRDFIHIADVVSVWTAALENPATFGRVFNLGIGYACSMNELVRRILAGFGHDPGQYPINYYEERPGDQRHMTADISAVCETLDWQPEISLDAGIQRTIDWARAHG